MRIVAVVVLVLAVLGLAVTAYVSATAGDRDREATPDLPEPHVVPTHEIVLLDPAGRLLDAGSRPELFVVHEGKVTEVWVHDTGAVHWLQSEPVEGAELLVLVAGCKPARVPITGKRTVVRLEAGFRARIRLRGDRPAMAAPGDFVGLGLERYVEEVAGVRLPGPTNLTTLAADAFDHDMPSHPQFMHLPEDGVLDLYVPEAGRYRFRFDLRWRRGNTSGSNNVGHPDGPQELRPGMPPLVLDWPTAGLTDAVNSIERRR